MIGRFFALGAVEVSLSACVEAGDIIEDPGAFECRERGASLMRVSYDQTSANPINFDAFGMRNYSVYAGGVSFRCSVNSDDQIVAFNRM
jgi:hypothetical protein